MFVRVAKPVRKKEIVDINLPVRNCKKKTFNEKKLKKKKKYINISYFFSTLLFPKFCKALATVGVNGFYDPLE